ncbi:unnamed protein product [Pieris macdunnoughi]|uniref:C2H2-type domain-containing protein n=1 Tax=Pieris macdunnoughi TaxID=345717 RepID=A0A821PDI7_9NEOP|nr:unnamed protein product [Pieris macdunnoughi]
MSGATVLKLEMDSDLCGVCGCSGELMTPEEYDASELPQVPLRSMLLQINNHKVIPEGRLCSSCIRRAVDAYQFSSALSAKGTPSLSDKVRLLRKRLLDLTQKIDVFIVVGGQNKESGAMYNEDDIIMVDRDALASAAAFDTDDLEKVKNAAGESVYQCTVCPMSFEVASEYRSHVNSHGSSARHSCWTCGAQFTSLEAFQDHTLLHRVQANNQLVNCCPVCEETFSSQSELGAHARAVHTSGISVCEVCSSAVPVDELPAHRLAHRQADRFLCGYDLCILRFPTRSDLMSHIRSCHAGTAGPDVSIDKPQGGQADGATGQTSRTMGHTGDSGSSERIVPCASCDRMFGSVAAMKRHSRVHRREETQQDEEWVAPTGVSRDVEYLEFETLDDLRDYPME